MTIFTNEIRIPEHANPMPHHHPLPGRHPSPKHPPHPHAGPAHERNRLQVHYDEQDVEVLLDVLDNADAAEAAVSMLHIAPSEIQILGLLIMDLANKLRPLLSAQETADQEIPDTGEALKENRFGWSHPLLDGAVLQLFRQHYGQSGSDLYAKLAAGPEEIAVLASILAHLNEKAGEINYELH